LACAKKRNSGPLTAKIANRVGDKMTPRSKLDGRGYLGSGKRIELHLYYLSNGAKKIVAVNLPSIEKFVAIN